MKWSEDAVESLATNKIIDICVAFCSLVMFLTSPLSSVMYAYVALFKYRWHSL